jgi:hypothetical protein
MRNLHVTTDERVLHQEALEEAADGVVYTAVALVRADKRRTRDL